MRKKTDPAPALWEHDRALIAVASASGFICGIDEVGRGPLAGNVVVACVILDLSKEPIAGVNDSKKVGPEMREALFPLIQKQALAWSIAEASVEEIDRLNILQATFLAMRRAVESLSLEPVLLLVDGNQTIPGISWPQKTLVGGDGISACIAAASILAKVARDRQMEEAHEHFPEYGFAQHKGYGTRQHCDALNKHGLSPIHRRSFCGSFTEVSFPA